MLRDDSAGRGQCKMLIRLREQTSARCQGMAHIAICENLYTRIIHVAVRPSTCNVVRKAFGTLLEHLIISKLLDVSDSYIV